MANNNDYVAMDGMSSYRDTIKTEKHYATMDDVVSEMKAKFPTILDMANAALNLSMAANQMGQQELAKGLAEIGAENFTHAYFVKHQMKDFGVVLDEKEYRDYKALEGRVEHFHI